MASPSDPPRLTAPPTVSRGALFAGFLRVGLLGFGGVGPWARHVVVEQRRWLTEPDYAALLALGQVLPGANTVNAAVMIGDRFQGVTGAVAAVAGLMAAPLVVLVGLASLYARHAGQSDVRAAIGGAAAAAAGLVIGTALKMARRLRPGPVAILLGLLAFAAAGLLGVPLGPTLLVLAPLSIAAAALDRRRR